MDTEIRTIPITKYTYHYLASHDSDDVVMYLYGEHDNVVAKVLCACGDAPLPRSEQIDGHYVLYFRRHRFPELVDMLRNEGPICLVWRGPTGTTLSTEYEPVGEGEMASHRRR